MNKDALFDANDPDGESGPAASCSSRGRGLDLGKEARTPSDQGSPA